MIKIHSCVISIMFFPLVWNIFIYMEKIFNLHGKDILQKLCATHKSSAYMLIIHCSQAHYSHSHAHAITTLGAI
jgi:hypothetical protein